MVNTGIGASALDALFCRQRVPTAARNQGGGSIPSPGRKSIAGSRSGPRHARSELPSLAAREVLSIVWALCLGVLMSGAAWGQIGRGTLTGAVQDPSGALVPNAAITLIDQGTNSRREAVSSGSGQFTFPELPPSVYDLLIKSPGFQQYMQRGITVTVGETTSVKPVMQVGESSTILDIVADASQLKSDSSDIGTSVSNQVIEDLPLAFGGQVRNPIQFIQLTPGFSGDPENAMGSRGLFKFNGGQSGGGDILVDGATIQLASPTLQMTYGVSVEAVQEFKVMTNTFSAEFGRTSGGIINMITKSGSNQLHGSVYDLLKNRVLDAFSFDEKRNTAFSGDPSASIQKPIDTQNDFGFLVSGPVILPKIYNGKDKTFFMVNYEGFRFNTGSTGMTTFPTEAFKQGDFSLLLPNTLIYDPSTCSGGGQCTSFAGNIIPANRLSKVSVAANQFLPKTTTNALENNTLVSSTSKTRADLWTWKIDQILSDKQRFNFSIDKDNRPNSGTSSLGSLYTGTSQQDNIYLRFSHDYTFSPTITNHFSAGFSRRYRLEGDGTGSLGAGIPEKIGLQGVMNTTWPCISWIGTPEGRVWGCGDSQFYDNTYQFNDSAFWIHGRHNIKFGFEMRKQQFNTHRFTYTSGSFDFAPTQTSNGTSDSGYALASYMLGAVNDGFVNLGKELGMRTRYYGAYVQDDFKVSSKFTLNLGFRYEIPQPNTEAHDRLSWLDPTLPNPGANGYPGAVVFAGSGAGKTGRSSPLDTWYKSFGPRVGLAYQVSPSTVVRAGYGIYYSALKISSFADNDSVGYFGQFNYNFPGGTAPAFNWDNGAPQNQPKPPFIDPTVANGSSVMYPLTNVARPGTIQNWTLDIQQQLGKNLILDVAYVGAHGDHLQANMRNPNQVNSKYLSYGPCLSVDITQQGSSASCSGMPVVPLPYASFTGSVAQALRPFPQYQDLWVDNDMSSNPFGFYTYHALQTKLEKRFSSGLTAMVSYTISKNLTNADSDYPLAAQWQGDNAGAVMDSYNAKLEKGLSELDIPQAVVINYTYELPIGPGKHFMNHGGVAGKLLGGWHVGGVDSYHRGVPTGVIAPSVNTGLFADLGTMRANVVSGVRQAGWSGSFNPDSSRFFNPAAFAIPANYTFGNAPRGLNLRETPTINEDLTVGKKTQIYESVNLDFRADFFNLFNRHRVLVGNMNIGDPARQDPTTGQLVGFGSYQSSSGPRSIQMSMKVTW